jgi:hypothetical protein
MKPRNPIARALRSPHLRPKTKPSAKVYARHRRRRCRMSRSAVISGRFAPDSPQEQSGFEPSIPPAKGGRLAAPL